MTQWGLPSERQVSMEFYRNQYSFLMSPDRFTSFIGGIGSGKTTAGSAKSLAESAKRNNALGLVVAPTYTMLRDATVRTLLDVLGPAVHHFNKSEMEIQLINGSTILCRSADKPDRLRGPNMHWAWIDEGPLCPPDTWDIVIGRLRADGTAGPCWLTGTPKGMNWVYEKRHLMRMYKATTMQNPFLHPDFVQSLIDSYAGDFAQQELHAEFMMFEGLIYEEFTYATHVIPFVRTRRTAVEVIGGGDEGFVNPQVYLVIAIDDDGGAHIIDEFYERKVRNSVAAKASKQLTDAHGVEVWYLDPSAAALRGDMEEEGLTVRKAKNAVTDGINLVKNLLATTNRYGPRLRIDPRCVQTIKEMEQYAWKDWKAGKKEEPIKMNDHTMDSGRYGLFSHLGGLSGQLMY